MLKLKKFLLDSEGIGNIKLFKIKEDDLQNYEFAQLKEIRINQENTNNYMINERTIINNYMIK